MEQYEIIERVAAGLRNMNKEPSALLFIDEDLGWTWDREDLCGIPVLHAIGLSCHWWGANTENCPFVPVGKTDGEITHDDRKRFAEAW